MESSQTLILLGSLFLVGLLADLVGRRTFLPRVALLLMVGFAFGPSGMGWIDRQAERWFPFIANVALVMIGFLLGGELTREALRAHGRSILLVTFGKVFGVFAVVAAGSVALGLPAEIALLLAAIATATDPAATTDVIHSDRASGPFTRTLLGIVAIDDIWGLIAFSVALAIVEAAGAAGSGAAAVLTYDIGGAIVLGVVLGAPAALLTGRIEPGEPMLAEALAVVFLCAGLAQWLEVSSVLAAMAMGATVTNLARHHRRPFRAIEGIEWPFLILFFALAGAMLDFGSLGSVAGWVAAYMVLRAVGTIGGSWVGVRLARDPDLGNRAAHWMGTALMPQAGIALGMALVASQRLPESAGTLLPILIASTALLELFGPVLTRLAIHGVGEAGAVGRAPGSPAAARPAAHSSRPPS